jgi:glycosyltransferase involved in cell wall biosynthesis
LIRRINLLITVGERLRSHFVERGARHSVVVGNWKRLEEFASTEEEKRKVRSRLGIPRGAMAVVCITQLLADRQIDELLDATDQCPNVYTILGGRGVLEARIRERAQRNPRIIFVGFVAAPEIPAYTCAADVVYYGFDPGNPNARFSAPNKLFEALAAGKPIISGDFGEIAEAVRHGGCGLLLPTYSAESVREAFETLQDVELRSRLARNALNLGRMEMNWATAEKTLYREYAALGSDKRAGLRASSGAGESPARDLLKRREW